MTLEEARRIIELLADGTNPQTGEILPEGDYIHHRDCVRALSIAASALTETRRPTNSPQRPANAGLPWSKEQDEELLRLYGERTPIEDLASHSERTTGSIRSRLVGLGQPFRRIY
jgi:hypothetical protein